MCTHNLLMGPGPCQLEHPIHHPPAGPAANRRRRQPEEAELTLAIGVKVEFRKALLSPLCLEHICFVDGGVEDAT